MGRSEGIGSYQRACGDYERIPQGPWKATPEHYFKDKFFIFMLGRRLYNLGRTSELLVCVWARKTFYTPNMTCRV